MEKNQTSCPKAVCEKIFRAIPFSPAFTTIRRISSRPQTSSSPAKLQARNSPSLANSDPPLRTIDIKTKLTSPQRPKPASNEGSEVPIKFDYTPYSVHNTNGQIPLARMAEQAKKPKPSEASVLTGQNHKSKGKAEKGNGQIQFQIERNDQANKEDAGKKLTHYEEGFAAFIHKTKKRIDQEHGENSPKAVGHNLGHGFDKDHHFSDYIDNTKRKIRTTPSIKDRSESFFK